MRGLRINGDETFVVQGRGRGVGGGWDRARDSPDNLAGAKGLAALQVDGEACVGCAIGTRADDALAEDSFHTLLVQEAQSNVSEFIG